MVLAVTLRFSALLLLEAPAALAQQAPQAPTRQSSAYQELQLFSGVLNQIRANYVDSVTYRELVRAAIDGMLHVLDPHSYFMPRADWEQRSARERGELPGVGLELGQEDSATTVLSVYPGSPAAKAGLEPGDRIATINDTAVAGLKLDDVSLRLAGPKGSTLRIRIDRGSRLEPDTLSVTLTRAVLRAPPVTISGMVDSATGYVRLIWFGLDAAHQLHDAVKRVKRQGARRLILDLRNNPGGVMDAAVDIASDFFPSGTVVFRTKGRKPEESHDFVTKRDGDFSDLPLIVLINGQSASAAEALAGSLQDHDRALIAGRRSFGKALVQTGFLLVPSGDMVELTVARVFTPNGRLIQRRYRGIGYVQYWSFAGKSGAAEDTLALFKTDHGREVRGGGGIAPDVPLPAPAAVPVWWSVASDSGFDIAVADSVAQQLPAGRAGLAEWLGDRPQWSRRLLAPLLERVHTRLGVLPHPDSALSDRLTLRLAARAATVRWPPDGGDELVIRADPDIHAALAYFSHLSALLGAPVH
ncbi:MAG TPA: S41 family peptidase [Gemmatimonadales bacterium]|nr:S41 family peptidase [Gemmatimonadales bacterium]